MKIQFIGVLFLLFVLGCSFVPDVDGSAEANSETGVSLLGEKRWIHGSPDCDTNQDAFVDIYKHNQTTFILRQNKCQTFEAPFIYVLIGENRIFVLDTGAIHADEGFSLYEQIKAIVGKDSVANKNMLVVHSHGHADHYQGDDHFADEPNVTLVRPTAQAVRDFFGFDEWPSGQSTIDLGGRELTIIPTPGHQEESITIYDHKTKWLLTGDTLYPGYIYTKDWGEYRDSIERLHSFSKTNEVKGIFGSHIEMKTTPRHFYAIGTTYQPHETKLDLTVENLAKLYAELERTPQAKRLVFDEFIIAPMGLLRRTMSDFVRWLKGL